MRMLSFGLFAALCAGLVCLPTTALSAKSQPVFAWTVKSKTAQVVLLGSIHVASADTYPLDPRIEKAFGAADTLVLETDMDPMAMQRAAMSMQAAAMYTPPDGLARHVDAPTVQRVTKAFAQLGLPGAMVNVMKPFMLAMTLSLTKMQKLGFRPDLGIDRHFYNLAQQHDKKVLALEAIEEQVALLTGMPESIQVAMLKQTIDELPQLKTTMDRTFAAWKKGDDRTIHELLVAPSKKRYPTVHQRLIVDRNRRMADKVAGYLKGKGRIFVVVGSAHLIGSDSILAMLKKKGHRATRL